MYQAYSLSASSPVERCTLTLNGDSRTEIHQLVIWSFPSHIHRMPDQHCPWIVSACMQRPTVAKASPCRSPQITPFPCGISDVKLMETRAFEPPQVHYGVCTDLFFTLFFLLNAQAKYETYSGTHKSNTSPCGLQ
jgi:hypothetical protein